MSGPYRESYGGGGGMPQLRMPTLTPVVKLLLLANAGVFVLQWLVLMAGGEAASASMVRMFGANPATWESWFPFVPVWQLLTSGFLHDPVGITHIFWNMLLLFFFGTMLEEIIGARRFLVTYTAALLVASVFHLLAAFAMGDRAPAIGASGGVLAVMVACAVLRPSTRVIVLFIPVALKWLVLALVVMDLFAASVIFKTGADGGGRTAHFAHLGGAFFGFLAARKGWIWKDPIEALRERRAVRARDQARDSDRRMDELLAKIHREGMNSLSRGEREFLKRMSRRG